MESAFSRIIVTGTDRASFLHNFCTNNIRDLKAGHSVEAFFADVRARVLGFGYVVATESRHEIWQPVARPERLFKHLSRYVIREDVQFDVPSDDGIAVFRTEEDTGSNTIPIAAASSSGLGMRLQFWWNQQSLLAVTNEYAAPADVVTGLAPASRQISASEYNALRIAERFPAPGVDITDEHLAPEAGRNPSAISYTKGCYLGQEPIARLDAMGHVNRLLKCVTVRGKVGLTGAEVQAEAGASLGVITSSATIGDDSLGLAILKLAHPARFVVWPDGTKLEVTAVD